MRLVRLLLVVWPVGGFAPVGSRRARATTLARRANEADERAGAPPRPSLDEEGDPEASLFELDGLLGWFVNERFASPESFIQGELARERELVAEIFATVSDLDRSARAAVAREVAFLEGEVALERQLANATVSFLRAELDRERALRDEVLGDLRAGFAFSVERKERE